MTAVDWQTAEQRHLAAAQAWLLARLRAHEAGGPPGDADARAALLAAWSDVLTDDQRRRLNTSP